MVLAACVGLIVGVAVGGFAWGRRDAGCLAWGVAAGALGIAAGLGFWAGWTTRSPSTVGIGVPPVERPASPSGRLGEDELQALIVDLRVATFPTHQLSLLAQRSRDRTFTPTQAARVLLCFTFDDDRLGALEVLAPRLDRREPLDPVIDAFRGPFGDVGAARMILGM